MEISENEIKEFLAYIKLKSLVQRTDEREILVFLQNVVNSTDNEFTSVEQFLEEFHKWDKNRK